MLGQVQFVYVLMLACLIRSWVQAQTSVDTHDSKEPALKSPCRLVAYSHYRDQLSDFLKKSKLIEISIYLEGHPPGMLDHVLTDLYRPYQWVLTTGVQGKNLLTLDDTYKQKSLSTLAIGVVSLEVNVTDHPRRCLRARSQEETIHIIRWSILMNFSMAQDERSVMIGWENHVCNVHIRKHGDYAQFVHRCCRGLSNGSMDCHDLTRNDWVQFLLALVIIIKVLVVMYSPLFLPESLYRERYIAGQYIYHVPGPPMTLKVALTQDPDQFGEDNRHKTVRLSSLENMEYFKAMVSNTSWIPEKVYEVQIKEVRLSVQARRLLDSVTVPVTLKTMLFNNLLLCRLRRLEPLKKCCASNILGKFNPCLKMVTWHTVMKLFAQFCLVTCLSIPWIFRVVFYFKYEADVIESKTRAAIERGLKPELPSNLVLHFTPIHGLFVIVYTFIIGELIIHGILYNGVKESFTDVIRKCLCDMKERSRIAILAWLTKLFVLPFEVFGIVGFIFIVPYVIILIIFAIPLVIFYICPTVNFTVRLLIHLVIFVCPQRITSKLEELSRKLNPVKARLNTREVTAKESFLTRHHYSCRGIILQFFLVVMCLLSFWSITVLLMEVVSFLVEVSVYTFMGVILNAGVTLHYITVILLVFMYSKSAFSQVHQVYQCYHKVIHKLLMEMKKEEISQVATQEALDQENTAFIVQGEVTAKKQRNFSPQMRVKHHKPQWLTYGMLVFLDKRDTPLTPEKFFHETIDLNYFGCPGPVHGRVCSALLEFLKIVIFLIFVFSVIMAFGEAYQISSTSQLLATVVGGFIPFILKNIFTASTCVDTIDTTSVQFKSELNKAINCYSQSWPIFDIIPVSVREWDGHAKEASNNNKIPGEVGDETTCLKTVTDPAGVTSSESSLDDNAEEMFVLIGNEDHRSTISNVVDVALDGSGAAIGPHGSNDEVLNQNTSQLQLDNDMIDIDIIVDISTSETRAKNALTHRGFERGSVSMLDSHQKKSEREHMPSEVIV